MNTKREVRLQYSPLGLIALQLRQARHQRGWSQAEAAKATGVSVSTVSRIENGWPIGSVRLFERYLAGLGFELTLQPAVRRLPKWDDIELLFHEDGA